MKTEILRSTVHLLAGGIATIAAFNAYALVTGNEALSTWGFKIGMAMPTSACLMLAAVCFIVLANRLK